MATTYAVINLSDTNAVLFSQVNQSSAQTMRRNVANTQGVLSYQVEPSFITNGSLVPVQTYDHAGILALLATPEWTPDDPPTEE
tara:strand:+ start:133 stop:384 length:252 start_codon:yes stop_codon:yes gene_type:complete